MRSPVVITAVYVVPQSIKRLCLSVGLPRQVSCPHLSVCLCLTVYARHTVRRGKNVSRRLISRL